MCGRVNVTDYQSIITSMEALAFPASMKIINNTSDKLFPYFKPLLVGFADEEGDADTAYMNWGWVRNWDKHKKLFNSRRVNKNKQPIWQSPVWGKAIRDQRCLIPVNAFYEWDENQPKGKRDRYRIFSHTPAFNLGGIYEISAEGEMFFSICTTESNEQMAEIHHRMPVIIESKDTEQWVYSSNKDEIDELMLAKSNDFLVIQKETDIGTTQNLF